jgi:prepilin-type N-terminal cleavage/methylation domain-containing protein
MFLFKNVISKNNGFTLIELLVTVAIFVFMTALVVANYGSFNDGTLLTSMSYDVALALRGAQSYGLNVKGATSGISQNFNYPYGMDFNLSTPSTQSQMIFFADSNPSLGNNLYGNGTYESSLDLNITTYTLARGGLIKCVEVLSAPPSGPCTSSNGVTDVDITFKRPDPNAIIKEVDTNGNVVPNGTSQTWPYAIIQVEDASKTSTRSIVVNQTGLIAVQNQ